MRAPRVRDFGAGSQVMVDCDVGGLSPLRGPLATVTADTKYTDTAARVASVVFRTRRHVSEWLVRSVSASVARTSAIEIRDQADGRSRMAERVVDRVVDRQS
jgi:hypothetical protein